MADNIYGDIYTANQRSAVIGQSLDVFAQLPTANLYNPRQQGVFALHPLATPKYARNTGLRDAEFRDTLARLYISLADAGETVQTAYLNSLPEDARVLAQVLLGANSQGGTGYVDFFLTQASEAFQEIVQVDKVMADDYVAFFYGQQPPTFTYSGTLLNSLQDDQRGGFARAYQQLLRGTQLARRGALARLRYDSVVVTGTLIAHQQQLNADNEMAVPFSFSFLVKEYVVLTNLPFARVTAADYVRLSADSSAAAVQPVGAVIDTRVQVVVSEPPLPAGVSIVGAASDPDALDPTLSPLQQLDARARAAGTPASGAANIRGTLDPVAALPPNARVTLPNFQSTP
jgi:hypothetical protein